MAKPNKRRGAAGREPPAPKSRAPSAAPGSRPGGVSGAKRWVFRGALSLGVPAFCLVTLELGLRLAGYGYSTSFFQLLPEGRAWTVNENFARQFYTKTAAAGKAHPFVMPIRKAAGTVRIFVLGESAAQGTPNPAFGFGRILEQLLRSQYPQKQFEVINAAMRGINSHIILPIARECARHEPDLFLIYAGNNEVVGLHAPGPDAGILNRKLTLIRVVDAWRATRVGQLLSAILEARARGHPPKQDMDFFRTRRIALDDPRRQRVYQFFQANLEEICEATTASGASVILSTVAVNLKDMPPLGSLHRADLGAAEREKWEAAYARGVAAETQGRWEEAVQSYAAAAAVDDHFADLHFRLGRAYFGRSDFARAAAHFGLARDWDTLPFRGDSAINEVIRRTGASYSGRHLELVEAERALAQSELGEHGIPAGKLFYEHVHLKFDGDYLLARSFLPAIGRVLGARLGPPANTELPTRQECAARLAFTLWDEVQAEASMVKMWGIPPFLDQLDHAPRYGRAEQEIKEQAGALSAAGLRETISLYRLALERNPADWQLHHNFGMFWLFQRDFEKAAQELEFEVRTFPNLAANRLPLASALARLGKTREAVQQLEAALRIDPQFTPAREAIATVQTGRLYANPPGLGGPAR